MRFSLKRNAIFLSTHVSFNSFYPYSYSVHSKWVCYLPSSPTSSILCDLERGSSMNIKLNLKIFVRFLFVVTYVLTAVTFTLQRVGLMKKGKQQKCSSFSKLSLSNVAFVSKVSITLFPFLSIYLTYLFLTCIIMCLYSIGKY